MPSRKSSKPKRAERLDHAFSAVRAAIDNGCIRPDIRRILRSEIINERLAEDYFADLTDKETIALHKCALDEMSARILRGHQTASAIEVPPEAPFVPATQSNRDSHNRSKLSSIQRGGPASPHGVLTPPPDELPNTLKCELSANSSARDGASFNGSIISEEYPTYQPDAPTIVLALFHLDKQTFDCVTAAHCDQHRSFISIDIIRRNRFFKHVILIEGQSIELTWRYQNPPPGASKKSQHNRFWIIASDKITHDIALGKGYQEIEDLDFEIDNEEIDDNADDRASEVALGMEALNLRNRDFLAMPHSSDAMHVSEEQIDRRIARLNTYSALTMAEAVSQQAAGPQQRLLAPQLLGSDSRSETAATSSRSSKSSRHHSSRRKN